MKIEIEIDEETAACLWADQTWHGKSPKPMDRVLKDVAEEAAARFKNAFIGAIPRTIEQFRTAQRH